LLLVANAIRVIFRWVSVIAGEFDAAERLNG